MKSNKRLFLMLPILVSMSLPAQANILNTYSVHAQDTLNGTSETINGTWTYDATSNSLQSALFTQNDTVNGKTFTYDLTSNTTQFFPSVSGFKVQSFVDTQGDFWPGFSLLSLSGLTGVGSSSNLDSANSTGFDLVGGLYHFTGNLSFDSQRTTGRVPEPAILALLAAGFAGLGYSRRKERLV